MWEEASIRELLDELVAGRSTVDAAVRRLQAPPTADLGFARLDHHRALRQGVPEVVYAAGKTAPQVAEIMHCLVAEHGRALATRATREQFDAVSERVPDVHYAEAAACIWVDRTSRATLPGVVVVTAGTADLPVAEEAVLTLAMLGHDARRVYDVGVAGIHRVLGEVETIQSANAVIVVAGMEGALPSVVGGLARCPVIAVPTSVGYGTGLGGFAAMLSMLNSCAAGVGVVNIDNGFGAACLAGRINALAHRTAV